MRIIYLHQYFNTPSHSGSTRSFEMARRFVQYGHEVHVVTSSRNASDAGTGWRETYEDGVHVHWLGVPYGNSMSYARRIYAFVEFALRSASRAATLRGDVVLATSTPLTIALPGAYASRRQRVPMVFEVRDLWPELPIAIGALRSRLPIIAARWLERFAYRRSTRIVALSPGMRDGIVATGFPAERVHVIPNCADLDRFALSTDAGASFRQTHRWLGDRPLVMYAGTVGRINGVDYLARVAAAALERDSEVRFLVVGSGGDEPRVRAVATELGVLDRNFFIHPAVAKRDVAVIFAATDIAVSLFVNLPAMWSNSANKFFDALASGTAVAINYGGWQAELLERSGAGMVLPADDPGAAAHALLGRLRDRSWLASTGTAAQRLAREQFDRDHLAQEFETVLLRAVADAGRAR